MRRLVDASTRRRGDVSTPQPKQTDERTNERTNKRTNERMNERTNERTNEQTKKYAAVYGRVRLVLICFCLNLVLSMFEFGCNMFSVLSKDIGGSDRKGPEINTVAST